MNDYKSKIAELIFFKREIETMAPCGRFIHERANVSFIVSTTLSLVKEKEIKEEHKEYIDNALKRVRSFLNKRG